MRGQQLSTIKAAADAPASAAMPIDVKSPDTSRRHNSGVNTSAYRYLEELWASALCQAEASILASPRSSTSRDQGITNAGEAGIVGHERSAVGRVVDKAGISLTCNDSDPALSSIPRGLIPSSSSAAYSPVPPSLPPTVPSQMPMPFPSSTHTWLRVEAQPNLKRNAYTARRGVAWVVQ
ncbi:hypothetical protein JKF63_02818 [Porcisia hertigi]|uniref:Uncharacterized protein n=1 Tax=Porcisia hertigi TaxID=2761500 RepID=A0A836L638_9TRYP|nr:hypothetical protein JKF63_02818 [Porcisia hertigi]